MTRRIFQNDVFAAAIPDGVPPEDQTKLLPVLDQMAREWVHHQWADGGARPDDVEFAASEWLITNKVWEVDQFQPAHDCEECRSGNEKSKAFLRANPGRWIAMANLSYTEVWP